MRHLARSSFGAAAIVLLLFPSANRAAQQHDAGTGDALRFRDVTSTTGVDFHLRSGTPSKRYLIEVMSGGVALLDFDNDGWVDLYLVNGSSLDEERQGHRREPNRLFRNDGDGTFTDVTETAGVGGRHWGMGVCAGDVNNDGWQDLYVTNAGPNLLFLGGEDGRFTDASGTSGASHPAWSSSCAFADADGDGDLDLYVSNYLDYDLESPPTRTNQGDRCSFRGLPGIEVACGPLGLTPVADAYYENRGDGRFLDATRRVGLAAVPPSYGLGVAWGDYDDDGDQDLYVANDEMVNFLFRNDGGSFTDVGVETGVGLSADGRIQGGMGVEFGDVDNDQDLDLIVTNFVDDYNTLYRNNGNGTFSDQTQGSAMVVPALPYVGWGVALVDLDLDGRVDIPIANGHLYPQLDRPAEDDSRLFGSSRLGDLVSGFVGLARPSGRGYVQRNQLFWNAGNGRFAEIGDGAGEGFRLSGSMSSRGLAAGDLDNDGLIDLVITNLDDEPSILRNDGRLGNWLLLRLRGTSSNRDAIGARVTVRSEHHVLRRDVRSGGTYQSEHDRRLHFGLGEDTLIDELEIRWPSGRVETRRDVAANQILEIREP